MIEANAVGLAAAFAAGLVSFISPCVLPLVPAYMSYVAGQSLESPARQVDTDERLVAVGMSALFVSGFSSVFIALGASATALGRLLLQHRYEANLIGGAIVILFGLLMLGLGNRLPWFQRELRFHPRVRAGRPLTPFVLGVAFGFGWTPCIDPVLGAILTLSAVQSTPSSGVALLATYAAGLGVPFLITAWFTRELASRMARLRRAGAVLNSVAGVILVLMGVGMISGQLSALSYWLLKTFPVFGRIG